MKSIKVVVAVLTTVLLAQYFFIGSVRAVSNTELLAAVNNARKNAGRNELKINRTLQTAAELKLKDIQQYRYWSHDNPVTKTSWISFVRNAGYFGVAGENLARGYQSGGEIVAAWLQSPSHRNNLLNTKFNQIGIAIGEVLYDKGTKKVIVTEFGQVQKLAWQ